jgi:hypothetical protein
MNKAPRFHIPVFLLLSAGMTGCGWHIPVLLNNEADSAKPDFKAKGVLAFQFTNPKDMKVEFCVNNLEGKELYKIAQGIDGIPHSISISGPLTEYGKTKYILNSPPLVYLYEIPPGNYDLRYMWVHGAPTDNSQRFPVGIKTGAFTIEPGTITYIGSINLSGDWGTLGLGFNAKFEFENLDSSDVVFAKLDKTEKFRLKDLSRKKSLISIEMNR